MPKSWTDVVNAAIARSVGASDDLTREYWKEHTDGTLRVLIDVGELDTGAAYRLVEEAVKASSPEDASQPRGNDDLPPGQKLTNRFPVLTAGPVPDVDATSWTLSVKRRGAPIRMWSLSDLRSAFERVELIAISTVSPGGPYGMFDGAGYP